MAAKKKFPKLHFGDITHNLTKILAQDDDGAIRRLLGLTPKQFDFYLDNLVGSRKVEQDNDEGDTCAYCGSGLIVNGECQKCGL